MSAGTHDPGSLLVVNSLQELAPLFRDAVEDALHECWRNDLDAKVYETWRSPALQALYYKRGRPPTEEYPSPVTNAEDNLHSWHGFGLAVDVISEQHGWSAPESWWRDVADIFQRNRCKSGYYWPHPDRPHHQWHLCKRSPSDVARDLYKRGGLDYVWKAVEAYS